MYIFKSSSNGLKLGLALVTSSFLMSGVQAQDQKIPYTTGSSLNPVDIKAKKEKIAVDTPNAVTVLDQEQLDQVQATTVGEVFDQVPGVMATGSGRVAGQSFNIRGVGDEEKITIVIDGAPKFYEQYRMGSLFTDPELYKQVEVLRGPAASTVHGSGAFAGVINLTTKDATDFLKPNDKGMVRLKGGYDTNNAGYLGSVIFANKLNQSTDLLVTGNYRTADNYKDGDGEEISGSEFSSWSGLIKGTHKFGANKEQIVRLSFQRWQSDLDDTSASQTRASTRFGTVDRKTTDDNFVLAYENPATNNPWLDFKFNLSYSNTEVIQRDSSATSTRSSIFNDVDYGYKTISGKAENVIDFSGESFDNFLTIGMQVSNQNRTGKVTPNSNFPASARPTHPEGTDKKVGVYVQSEFVFNDALTIIPGARVDFVKLETASSIQAFTSEAKTEATLFSPKLAAMYQINDNFSVFGSYAHTERTPTLDEMFSAGPHHRNRYPGGRTASLDLTSETSQNYELGFTITRNNILTSSDAFRLKTTVFHNDFKDLISRNPDNANQLAAVPANVNIGESVIKGAEVEIAYSGERHFSRIAYSHIEGEDKITGKSLRTIPADNLNITVGSKIPSKNLEFGWKGRFVDEITVPGWGSRAPTDYASYGVNGIYMGWQPKTGTLAGFEVRASVDNMFDKTYRNSLISENGKGRAIKLTVAKDFRY